MLNDPVSLQLDQLELQFSQASEALLSGSSDDIQLASVSLQKGAVELLQLVDELGRNRLDKLRHAERLHLLAAGISVLRENLLRRAAFVEQGLQILMPSAKRTTYSPVIGPYGSSSVGAKRGAMA
ncbi:hypothetical protein [Rhodoferax aquaticus]|uniref:Flagellar protein FlgN n=1 Tax=Rhodoferax aquaticus TaxID=2527691 RepID=A0A515ETU8_9BURK|nr:hypothetical protein [Rhodoferax aquaticus]QDL56105.1 hypothetical protein EXZ61_19145 [Rhodoferax aquaticus]